MKTLRHPIDSLSRILYDSPGVALGNQIFGNRQDALNTQLRNEGDGFIISVPVPGMSKEDLSVYIEGRVIFITTKRLAKATENSTLSKTDVKHSFVLPEGIDVNSIRAKCRNGLLTVNIERMKSRKGPTVIKVLGEEERGKATRGTSKLWDKIKDKIHVSI